MVETRFFVSFGRAENINNLPSADASYLSEYEGITVCVIIKRSNMAWVSQRILEWVAFWSRNNKARPDVTDVYVLVADASKSQSTVISMELHTHCARKTQKKHIYNTQKRICLAPVKSIQKSSGFLELAPRRLSNQSRCCVGQRIDSTRRQQKEISPVSKNTATRPVKKYMETIISYIEKK